MNRVSDLDTGSGAGYSPGSGHSQKSFL